MDRRQHIRFDLSAPVTYTWKNAKGIRQSSTGVTRDVSEGGLFIITDSRPAAGTLIRFEVSFLFRDNSQIQMRARGKILRVEPDGDAKQYAGFAAATKMLWLYNNRLPVS